MELIADTAQLAAACAAMAKSPFVALDTEFMRETTYWPKLCLVQAATADVEAVIDPLAPGLDLAPLLGLMANPGVVKVFHAPRQDLEIFLKLMGRLPEPVFDSQIAAMACGYGESIAYDGLVAAVLKRRIDKTQRFTDWSRRPLSEEQLRYALADVTHLRDLYPKLLEKLETSGRAAWVADELAALVDPANYDTDPDRAWKRLKVRKGSKDFLVALQAAAAWRERAAQAKDVPRGRILKDDALLEIAEQRPKDPDAFDRLRATPKGFGRSRQGQELASAIAAGLADPERAAPDLDRGPPPPPSAGPTVELLKVLLRYAADQHGVASKLIGTTADIEAIAADDAADVPALTGWRREVFGAAALDLKHGRIALTLVGGKVAVVPTP